MCVKIHANDKAEHSIWQTTGMIVTCLCFHLKKYWYYIWVTFSDAQFLFCTSIFQV